MSPRVATTGIFLVNGAAVGTWIAQIPAAQERLDISKSVIGLALLCMAVGALVAMPLTGQLLARRPSARVTQVAILVECVLIPLPLLAPSPWLLAGALVVFGAANGAADVAMNAHGIAVEKRLGRSIMSSLHAGWSFGGLAGAGAVALGAVAGLDPRVEAALAGAVLFVLAGFVSLRLGTATAATGAGPAPKLSRPPRGVVLLGALCFLIMVIEGAMGDWSGLYLRDDLHADPSLASIGFAGFSAGMAGGRLFGDRWPTGSAARSWCAPAARWSSSRSAGCCWRASRPSPWSASRSWGSASPTRCRCCSAPPGASRGPTRRPRWPPCSRWATRASSPGRP